MERGEETGGAGGSRPLSRREFDEVIRRATEHAASEADAAEGRLTESDVLRIAREVGLPERHVRLALGEVRSGAPAPPVGVLDRVLGPEGVRASRLVPGTPRVLADRLDAFLVGGRLLQSVRATERLLQYRPAVDWASQVARVASATARSYYVAAARVVEVRLEEIEPGRTLVDVAVDPGTRGDAIGEAVAGAAVGGALGLVGALTLTPLAPGGVVAATAAVACVFGAGSTAWAATRHRRKLGDVQAEVEGILDRLEAGDALEPPPSAWRRWVFRHFHGVARDSFVKDP